MRSVSKTTSSVAVTIYEPLSRLIEVKLHRDARAITVFGADGLDDGGVLIRTTVKSIRESGRSTQGVTLINLGEGEKLSGIERIDEPDLPEAPGDQTELI